MKAILEFDLMEDSIEHLRCVKSAYLVIALQEINNLLWKKIEITSANFNSIIKDNNIEELIFQ